MEDHTLTLICKTVLLIEIYVFHQFKIVCSFTVWLNLKHFFVIQEQEQYRMKYFSEANEQYYNKEKNLYGTKGLTLKYFQQGTVKSMIQSSLHAMYKWSVVKEYE